ncbi:MAG: FAD-dependent oxidoreductase [Spirochaetales bacterium]|nr:FAD-dependent oxidoreductase [Spirochaetales bacterium]
MDKAKHIVILGGGYGGILTAKKLAKKFKKNENVKITLIDKNNYHTMLTELHEVAAGRVPEDAIRINFDKVFAGRKVDVLLDEITNIDFDKKVITGNVSCTKYDYLVLGTGSKPTFFGTQGAKENAFTLWSYEDAVKIKHHMLEVFGKASVETDLSKRRRLLTFVVIGCGFTGIEMIGELAEWRKKLCHTFSIPEVEVRMIIADMLPKVLPNFDERLIKKTTKRLEKLNVEIMLNSPIKNIQPDFIEIGGQGKIESNTVIWAAGIEGSTIMSNLDSDKFEKVARNRVQTDEYLRAKGHNNVFVVGDNIFYIPEGEKAPVPQMVENAEHSAATVSYNIFADIENKELKSYKPTFHGAMVCIGGRYGVAQIGNPGKQIVLSGFLAMLTKHFVNFIYFMQVAGFHKLWTYWMHEFFHVECRRSFLGGHFSKRSPNFWLVPLRLFVGGMWVYEGWEKLLRVIEYPDSIFLLASKIAATSASPVEDAATTVAALPVPEFITAIVNWSMDLIFYTSTGEFTFMATVFQTFMILAEIIVGLCLMGGLFTALASIVSVLMGIMIWASGMAPFEMLWFMAGGIALIGGSGSTFGLDYYVLPFLSKYWKKIKFVKKWYLYTDGQ